MRTPLAAYTLLTCALMVFPLSSACRKGPTPTATKQVSTVLALDVEGLFDQTQPIEYVYSTLTQDDQKGKDPRDPSNSKRLVLRPNEDRHVGLFRVLHELDMWSQDEEI